VATCGVATRGGIGNGAAPPGQRRKSAKWQSRSPRPPIGDGYGERGLYIILIYERGYNGIILLYFLEYFSLLAVVFDRRPLPTAADDHARPPFPFSIIVVLY